MRRCRGVAPHALLSLRRGTAGGSGGEGPPSDVGERAPDEPTAKTLPKLEIGSGPDNVEGQYAEPTPPSYFEREFPAPSRKPKPEAYADRSDNIKFPEYSTTFGKFEVPPPHLTGGPGAMRYEGFAPDKMKESVTYDDIIPKTAVEGHHPHFDYIDRTGHKQGTTALSGNTYLNWEIKVALFSLYRCILKALPSVKQFYLILAPLPQMRDRIRARFMSNRYVRDPEAVRSLLHTAWMEYQEILILRRTRSTVAKYFDEEETEYMQEYYARQEGQSIEERKFWSGGEQRAEGTFEGGQWSWFGVQAEKQFKQLAGRVPKSWTAGRGYFEMHRPDGTNYWEKSLDYEGWYLKNVDPDRSQARKEWSTMVEAAYTQPRHYASKNRRTYRRMVKDIETIMSSSFEELYSRNREMQFQWFLRERNPETNRISAEKKLAWLDDQVYSTKHDEYEKYLKQVMREMPSPRLWKTDAFYFRLRYLVSALDYNWAKVPLGARQEKFYSEWVSLDANYAALNSRAFTYLKTDKRRNPMAWSYGDFYNTFDPDVPETRRLPWHHPDFDYDRRYRWDERCMRMKKWVQSGNIDVKRSYFDGIIHEYEQVTNRPELAFHYSDGPEKRYCAPRMVQMYRSFNRVMDVALAWQIKNFAAAKAGATDIDAWPEAKVAALIDESTDFADFRFNVPVLIYPDNVEQPPLRFDGMPVTLREDLRMATP